MNPIRVILFEDNDSLRDAMFYLINGSSGFVCVNKSPNAMDAVSTIDKCNPDVVLMDIDMPGKTGIEATKEIRAAYPELPILMQTVFEEDAKIFDAVCAGANGYILKHTSPVKLLESIKDVYEGGAPMTPSIATKVLKFFSNKPAALPTEDFQLSEREKDILHNLTNGLSYKMIAEKCFISYETVHSHIKKIYKKLQVNSVSEAVSIAIKHRIV